MDDELTNRQISELGNAVTESWESRETAHCAIYFCEELLRSERVYTGQVACDFSQPGSRRRREVDLHFRCATRRASSSALTVLHGTPMPA